MSKKERKRRKNFRKVQDDSDAKDTASTYNWQADRNRGEMRDRLDYYADKERGCDCINNRGAPGQHWPSCPLSAEPKWETVGDDSVRSSHTSKATRTTNSTGADYLVMPGGASQAIRKATEYFLQPMGDVRALEPGGPPYGLWSPEHDAWLVEGYPNNRGPFAKQGGGVVVWSTGAERAMQFQETFPLAQTPFEGTRWRPLNPNQDLLDVTVSFSDACKPAPSDSPKSSFSVSENSKSVCGAFLTQEALEKAFERISIETAAPPELVEEIRQHYPILLVVRAFCELSNLGFSPSQIIAGVKGMQQTTAKVDADPPIDARALHRVVRAMHDGSCPECGFLADASQFRSPSSCATAYVCPKCRFCVTDGVAEVAMQIFRPTMAKSLEIFKQWERNLGQAKGD